MENGTTSNNRSPRTSVRDRLRQANELQALPPETLERLLNLPDRLSAAVDAASLTLEDTTGRTASRLQNTVPETVDGSARRMVRAARRLTKQQHALAETERSLAYTIERLQRQADRIGWMQTGVIVLALIAGMLGGMAAAFVILSWTR